MSLKTISKNFDMLPSDMQDVVSSIIDLFLESKSAKTIHRTSKRGLENKPGTIDDEDVPVVRKAGRPKKHVEDDEAPAPRKPGRPRKEVVEEPVPSKKNKPEKVEAKAAPVKPAANNVYDGIIAQGKGKTEKTEFVANAIKKIEKFVANDLDWHEALALANKKKVEVVFGRGKPSDASNKRKIGVAMINAGVKF